MKTRHLALFHVPPFKPPHKNHRRFKFWIGPLHGFLEAQTHPTLRFNLEVYT